MWVLGVYGCKVWAWVEGVTHLGWVKVNPDPVQLCVGGCVWVYVWVEGVLLTLAG